MLEPDYDAPRDQERVFHYFDAEAGVWISLANFNTPEHMAAFITVDNVLYAVGCLDPQFRTRTPGMLPLLKDFFKYNSETYIWERLPSMSKPHDAETVKLVSLDGCIYVIGGVYYDLNDDDVERFDIEKGEWETLAHLPERFNMTSAISYQGRILVYGILRQENYMMLEYRQDTDTWEIVLLDPLQNPNHDRYDPSVPLVFVHHGLVYRVVYEKTPKSRMLWWARDDRIMNQHKPSVVHNLRIDGPGTEVSIGDRIDQNLIPLNLCGALRIQDEVLVNARGFIVQTNLKIGKDQKADVDLSSWGSIEVGHHDSNVTYFTFDKKKLDF